MFSVYIVDSCRIHDDHAMLWRERETHHQHCKQLMKEFSILKLKYKRVSGYRADLVFQKQYLLSVAGSLM